MAHDVMRHRLVLSFEAYADGMTSDGILVGHRRPRPASHRAAQAAGPCSPRPRLSRSSSGSTGTSSGASTACSRATTAASSAAPGMDIAALREYQPGDDVRSIDWNVTARLDTPYVREHHEDREVTAWFLLDLSPSVDFGSQPTGRAKRDVLVDFVVSAGAHPDPARQPGRRHRPMRADVEQALPAARRPASRCCGSSRTWQSRPRLDARSRRPTCGRCWRRRCGRSAAARSSSSCPTSSASRAGRLPLAMLAAAPRRPCRPACRPLGGRAARRGRRHPRGCRDRRDAVRGHARRRPPRALPPRPRRRARRGRASAFARAGVDAATPGHGRGPRAGHRAHGPPSPAAPTGIGRVVHLAVDARRPAAPARSASRPTSPSADAAARDSGAVGSGRPWRRPGRRAPVASPSAVPAALTICALALIVVSLARPAGRHLGAPPGGHPHPHRRRLGQHGRRRHRAEPTRAGQGRRPRARQAASRRRRHGHRGLRRFGALRAGADPGRRGARASHRPARADVRDVAGRGHPGRARHDRPRGGRHPGRVLQQPRTGAQPGAGVARARQPERRPPSSS